MKGNLLVLIISIINISEKRFSREHTDYPNPNSNVRARPDITVSAVRYHLRSKLAIHIYYVKYENALTCKRIS